jgi:hypothetical protein
MCHSQRLLLADNAARFALLSRAAYDLELFPVASLPKGHLSTNLIKNVPSLLPLVDIA